MKSARPTEEDLAEVATCRRLAAGWAPLLRAVGNEERLLIVLWLAGGGRSVRELEQVTELGQSTVSYHLAQLRDAGLVVASAEGRTNRYRLRTEQLDAVAQLLGEVSPSAAPR